MTTTTISFSDDQLRLLNAAIVELPHRLAHPLLVHISNEIQKQGRQAETQTPGYSPENQHSISIKD